jgi:hypothetical protein
LCANPTAEQVLASRVLNTRQLAERHKVEPDTVTHWRLSGKGPEWFRIGRAVLYALDAVEKWERETGRQPA